MVNLERIVVVVMDGSDYFNYVFDCKYFILNYCVDFVYVFDVVVCVCVLLYVVWFVSLYFILIYILRVFK